MGNPYGKRETILFYHQCIGEKEENSPDTVWKMLNAH
jgi:hypothetical protein